MRVEFDRARRVSELFPRVPVYISTPPGRRRIMRVGTRHIYADLPYSHLLIHFMVRASKEADTAEEVRTRWEEFFREYGHLWTFEGKPFVKVLVRSRPRGRAGRTLVLKIDWVVFLSYLEKRAEEAVRRARYGSKKGTESSVREFCEAYYDVWTPMYLLILTKLKWQRFEPITSRDVQEFKLRERTRFLKLLRLTGDYEAIERGMDRVEAAIRELEDLLRPEVGLYALAPVIQRLHSDLAVLRSMTLNEANFVGAYSSLRKILESLAKMCVILDEISKLCENENINTGEENLCKGLNEAKRVFLKLLAANLVLELDFIIRETKPCEIGDWRKSVEEIAKDLRHVFIENLLWNSSLSSEEKGRILWERYSEYVDDKSRRWRPLKLDSKRINNALASLLGRAGRKSVAGRCRFDRLYAICSEAVHAISPPPHYSLLEAKLFRYFLQWFAEALEVATKSFTEVFYTFISPHGESSGQIEGENLLRLWY